MLLKLEHCAPAMEAKGLIMEMYMQRVEGDAIAFMIGFERLI